MNILINSSIVILDECLSSFRILDNQQSNNKEMIIGGAKDYKCMLLDSKKVGLFTNNMKYYRALINCKKYVDSIINKGDYDSELLKMQEEVYDKINVLKKETEKKYNNFMDEGKRDILFVILSDNKQYYRECVRYINDLYVPSGYNLKIIDYIQLDEDIKNKNKLDVFSAKYKVYLQDTTFIINRNFIYDVLNIFKDDSIGMIGICGTNKQVDNYKNIEWNCGKYIFYNGKNTVKRTSITDSNEEYTYVNKVDDKLLITQYDFDFYNEYKDDNFVKSTKMFQRGYKIVVPNKKIWCFCEEKIEVSDDNKIIIENLVQKGDINLIEKLYNKLNLSDLNNRYFNEVINILEAFLIEIKKDKECDKKLFKGLELKKLIKHYNYLKFLLRRIQYNFNDERISDFEIDIKKRKISFNLVYKIMVTSLISNENAYQVLYNGYSNTKEKPLISVIIPTYNSSCLLRDTIDSILNQTYENIEVIVIDDGSTDSTKEILQSYTDKRIKSIFLEKNMNVCNAGNIGFKQAKGKYIALVGHDDIWKEDKLQKQILFMEYNINYGLCFTWANIINENKKIVNEKNNELYNLFCSRNYSSSYCLYKLLSQGNFLCAPSVLIRSEMLKKVGYYHYGFVQLQDYDLWIRFLMNSYYMYIMPEKLTYYRWFDDKNKNLSGLNQRKRIRIYNETSLIIDYSIWNMDKSIFIKTFFDNLTGIDKLNDKDIICKKVMLLLKMNNKYVIKRLAEVLEDDECRKILEESYNFTLKDFYELNTKII